MFPRRENDFESGLTLFFRRGRSKPKRFQRKHFPLQTQAEEERKREEEALDLEDRLVVVVVGKNLMIALR